MYFGGKKGRKDGRKVWVCPYLSPECGEAGLKNLGCYLSQKCIEVIEVEVKKK